MKVIVLSASRHGSTHEVADAIAMELREHGHNAISHEIQDDDTIHGADAVILGSAIYMGRWMKPARRLIESRRSELSQLPLWLFSVGPLGDPPVPVDPGPQELEEWMAATGAIDHQVFGGRLDRSELSRTERLTVKAVGAPDGDFRDWAAIREWADSIAYELHTGPVTRPRHGGQVAIGTAIAK